MLRRFWLVLLMQTCIMCVGQAFVYPEIPDSLELTGSRAIYMAQHFWDNTDLKDTTLFITPDHMLDYIYVLSQISYDEIKPNVVGFLETLSQHEDNLSRCQWWFEHFLNDYQSPLYDTELYLAIVDAFLDAQIDDAFKIRPQWQKPILMKNRVAHQANNFCFTYWDGTQHCLEEYMGTPILLLFHNPSCELCHHVINEMSKSVILSDFLEKGDLIVLAISLEPTHEPLEFDGWLCGYTDESFDEGQLYEIQQLPCFYILDRSHRVLLRQAGWTKCEKLLQIVRDK